MSAYKQYPKYKPSGVEWLGDVPEGWALRRSKFLFRKRAEEPVPDDGIVTAFRDGQVTLRTNRRTDGFTNALQEIGYQRVHKGDLVVHAMDAFAGAIGISEATGKCSPVCSVCTPWNAHEFLMGYYGSLLRSMALSGFVESLAKGIRERSTDFRFADFKELWLPLPPLPEQRQIAAFLDCECGKLDALQAKQERLIELLKEKRQALISHAVTKGLPGVAAAKTGLDPAAKLKPSGIEWLGDVPGHWMDARLRFLTSSITDGPHFSPPYLDTGVLFISARNIKEDGWSFGDAKFVSEDLADEFDKRTKPVRGDVLLTKGGTTGIARAVDFDERFQVWVHVAILRPLKKRIIPQFMAYALNSRGGYAQSQLYTQGATNNDLGVTRIANIYIALPPLAEQRAIVAHLDEKCGKFDLLKAKAERAIELIKERRSALISAAVTGKIDVRKN